MMVFEDEDRDEEEEQDDDNDNDNDNNNHNEPEPEPEPETMILLTPPTFHTHHHHNHNNNNNKLSAVVVPRYRECLKNHAVNIGGHALDGCGEFMPAGPDGTIDALKCAACNCHRNFHRKEHVTAADNHRQLTLYHPPPPHVYQFYRPAVSPTTPTTPGFLAAAGGRQLVLPAGETAEEQVTGGMMAMTMTTTTNTTTSSSGKKRHRTKFSQEQKDKMLALAEKLGWKIQKCDESVIQEFCDESGVKRHVLKVWMHNNKHTLGKKPPC